MSSRLVRLEETGAKPPKNDECIEDKAEQELTCISHAITLRREVLEDILGDVRTARELLFRALFIAGESLTVVQAIVEANPEIVFMPSPWDLPIHEAVRAGSSSEVVESIKQLF